MGGIFISYRRGDAAGMAGRVYDRLKQRLPRSDIFMDVDGLEAGVDFVNQLEAKLAKCDVLVAIMGPGWIDARDPSGARRLDSATDFVRKEITTALGRGIKVVLHEVLRHNDVADLYAIAQPARHASEDNALCTEALNQGRSGCGCGNLANF